MDVQQRQEQQREFQELRKRIPWKEQERYEVLRSMVLFGQSPAERALETGVARSTLYRRVQRFHQLGMVSLFTDEVVHASKPSLPPDMRQFIVDLKAEHSLFRPNEIATICGLHFGRRPSPHTVQRVLADGPPPSRKTRRYPPYQDMPDPAAARHAVITLHAEGWNAKSIAVYLGTSRQTVHTILRRWIEEGRLGLEDKTPGRKPGFRTVDFTTMATIRQKQQDNPLLGGFRMHAALLRLGIRVSVRTCNRIMAHYRQLYGFGEQAQESHAKQPMPFAASRRHEYWTTDVRYLDTPLLGQQAYCVTILDNFSRAIVASIVSPTQDLAAYLKVLRDAIRAFGSPGAIVSDGGGIFKANAAKAVYAALHIKKEQIAKRQAWQSYIESNFGLQRRLADVHFARARSWSELWAMHDQWVTEHNWQVHWAHRHREDGRYAPAEVLGFVRGHFWTSEEIERAFRYRSGRTVNRHGFVRYWNWQLYAERGLVGQPVVVWRCGSHLLIEHQDEPLAQYAVEFAPDGVHPAKGVEPRFFEHRFPSSQPFLLDLSDLPWQPACRVERHCRRRRLLVASNQPWLFDVQGRATS